MTDKSGAKQVTAGQTTLDVFWGRAEDLEPIYADNLHLQALNDQFYLTFGQVRVPVVEGQPVERVVAEIRPVSRLIMSKAALQAVLKLLERTLKEEK